MTLEERLELLRPMSCRDACRTAWLTDALVRTDGARARLRRWVDAGRPDPPAHCLAGFLGPERGIFNAFERAVARIPAPPVRWFVARNVVGVGVGDRANGWVITWPTSLTTGADEALQLAAVGDAPNAEELESTIAHELVHCWLEPVQSAWSGPTVEGLRDPPDFAKLAAGWGASFRNLVRLDEWRVASLAQSWGFRGRASDPTRYEQRMIVTGSER
jgi:hypothetical protein